MDDVPRLHRLGRRSLGQCRHRDWLERHRDLSAHLGNAAHTDRQLQRRSAAAHPPRGGGWTLPRDSKRRVRDGSEAGPVDHWRRARACKRHRACAARRFHASDLRSQPRPARRSGGLVQLDDGQRRGSPSRKSGEGAPRTGAAHCPPDSDVAPAAGAARSGRPFDDRALRTRTRSRRRLLRLPPAGRPPRRHHHRGCRREGDVGGALHGGTERSDAVTHPAPRVAARAAHQSESHHRAAPRCPQLHHHDVCRGRYVHANVHLRASWTLSAHLLEGGRGKREGGFGKKPRGCRKAIPRQVASPYRFRR